MGPRAGRLLLALPVLLLGGCGWLIGTPAPQGSDALISVAVVGDVPSDELSLEIGRAAWSVEGAPGVASLSTGLPPVVRLVRVADCDVLAEFDAEPGMPYLIRLGAGGRADVEPWTDAIDAGGPLDPRGAPAACD